MDPLPGAEDSPRRLVWDLPTRLFHWLLALSFCGSWITAEAGIDWTELHFLLGYTTLGLVLFRICWGFLGPRHARFSSFLTGPAAWVNHARGLLRREPSGAVGHNPLGGLMVILLLGLLALQAGTGLFITDDIFYSGPWNGAVSSDTAKWLHGIHHQNFTLLQVAIGLHLAAAAFYFFFKRENLIWPMITGRKRGVEAGAEISGSRVVAALILAGVAIAAIYLLVVTFAPPPAEMDYY